MTGRAIQALVVGDATSGLGFEIRTLDVTVSAFQRAIECNYMDAMTGTDWAMYFDESGNGLPNRAASHLCGKLLGVGNVLTVEGRCLFVGRTGSDETSVPAHVIDMALTLVPRTDSLTISLFRHRKHLFVYDDADACSKDLLGVIAQHRDAADLDPIEAYYGISPVQWVELRVEIMDDWSVQLHDHRNDRSYG